MPQSGTEAEQKDAASADTSPILTPEAERALAEAAARRQSRLNAETAKEVGGRNGPDPVRYGDWETGGIVSDF